MGLTVYAYCSDREPNADTNCRTPWEYIQEGQHAGLMKDAGVDTKIFEWDRYWDIQCWFHNLFLEKGGIYTDKSLPFAHPDSVELNDDDLDRLKQVILNLRLPTCDSYLDVKPEGVSLCKTWFSMNEKAKLAMTRDFGRHLDWLEETIGFIYNASVLIGEGKYIYVFCSY